MSDNKDNRSSLERKFDTDLDNITRDECIQLVRILKDERNCWIKNAKEWEKHNKVLAQDLAEAQTEFDKYREEWPMEGLA